MVHEQLDAIGLGKPYRAVVSGLAAVLFCVPPLEPLFVAVSRRLWSTPTLGRIVRSTAHRLVDRLRGSGREYRAITIAGITLKADVTHWLFTSWYFADVGYEPDTLRYLSTQLPAAGTFVDIGSNAGLMTLVAARLVGPRGRVFAFEPNPPVFTELTTLVTRNGFDDRVRASPLAMSDANGRATLHVTPVLSGLSSMVPDEAPATASLRAADSYTVDIQTRRFDDWVKNTGVNQIDLVKIDVEGAEDRVLNGMRESLAAGRITRLICETPVGSVAHHILLAHGYAATELESWGDIKNYAYEKVATPQTIEN